MYYISTCLYNYVCMFEELQSNRTELIDHMLYICECIDYNAELLTLSTYFPRLLLRSVPNENCFY